MISDRVTGADFRSDTADWILHSVAPGKRVWRLELEPGKFILKTEFLEEDALIDQNRALFDDSHGQRFGDGRVVARVPLNKFYSDLAGKIREGDSEHLKWWLNRDETRPWRTFRGKF